MSRSLAAVLLVTVVGVVPARAQTPQAGPAPLSMNFAALDVQPPAPAVSFLPAEVSAAPKAAVPALTPPPPQRAMSLNVLCVSYAALQAIDLHTTFRALDNGAREANPLIGAFSSNKAAMVAFKAGMTAGTIYLVRRSGIKNRTASTIMMAALNSAYAIIAAHNYHVANALR